MRRLSESEAVALCRYAKAMWPHMAVDEFTPDAWGEVLAEFRAEDCKQAILNLAKRENFVSVGAIYGEVKRIRCKRAELAELPEPPTGLSRAEYLEWNRKVLRDAGDGILPTARPAIQRAPWSEDARREAIIQLAESKGLPQ